MYSIDEVDEVSLEQFKEGTLNGMYQCHEVFEEEFFRFRRSLEDVWTVYASEVITPEKKERMDQMQFAIDSLGVFEEFFQQSYMEKLDRFKGDYNPVKGPVRPPALGDKLWDED
jgi:hypothetical protein